MHIKKFVIGTLIVIGIAITWVISTQITKNIQTNKDFNCPFFIIWFGTSWMIICIIPPILKNKKFKADLAKDNFSLKKTFISSIIFCFMWIIANYFYVWALKFINASDVTAIFSSANAFVFIFSIFLLKENIKFLKILSVLFSIGGIISIAVDDMGSSNNYKGVLFSLISAIFAALYKVLLKRRLGDPHLLTTSFFLGLLGISNLIFFWPVVLIFNETKYEILSNVPWEFLIASSGASLLFNMLINFGIAYTYPLFISIGTIIGIPLNLVFDIIVNQNNVGNLQILGSCLVVVGFFCLLIDNYFGLKENKLEINENFDLLPDIKTNENLLRRENLITNNSTC